MSVFDINPIALPASDAAVCQGVALDEIVVARVHGPTTAGRIGGARANVEALSVGVVNVVVQYLNMIRSITAAAGAVVRGAHVDARPARTTYGR